MSRPSIGPQPVDPATGAVVNLTNDADDDASPSWSPDATEIVFDSFRSTGQPSIHVMDAAGGDIRRISGTSCCERDFQPAWSPDGQRIAFASTRDGDGEYELYVMDAAGEILGSPAIRLTDDAAPEFGAGINDWQVTWSPDSSRLAFVSNRDPDDADICDLWVMDAADTDANGFGDNLTRLTFDGDSECEINSPAWSPTSDRIAFTSTRSFDYEVWVINADGTNPVNVTNFPGQDFGAGWSPDGTLITFVSGRDGDYEIYSVPAPPANAFSLSGPAAATQLTHNTTADVDPDWGVRGPPTAIAVWELTARKVRSGMAIGWHGGTVSAPIGFNVWRSTRPDTRYRKLNRSLIATAQVGTAGSYRFVDRAPTARRPFYRLEVVLLDGSSVWTAPVRARS